MRSPPLFLRYDRLDDLHVHGIVADLRHFCGYARPMEEALSVAGKARPSSQALGVVIGRVGVPCEKEPRIFIAARSQCPSSFQPI